MTSTATAPLIREPGPQEVEGACNARLTNGRGLCKQPAGAGTDHKGVGRCKHHFGSTRAHQTSAAREMLAKGIAFYGDPVDVRPHEALLDEIRRTAGHVAWLDDKVKHGEFEGDARERQVAIATTLSAYNSERSHLVKVCQVALHAGVEERQVRVAERMGAELANLIGAILGDLHLSGSQQKRAPEIVRRHLRVLEAGT